MHKRFEVSKHDILEHFQGVDNLRENIERNQHRNPKHSVLDLLKKLLKLNSMQVFANLDGNLIHNYYWMLVVSRDNLEQTAALIQEAVRERNLFAFAYPDDHERRDYHNEVASSYFPVHFTKLFTVLKTAQIATQNNVMRLRDLVATLAKDTRYEPTMALSALLQLLEFMQGHSLLTTPNLQVIIQNRTYAIDGMMINGIPGREVLPMVNLLQSLKVLFADDFKSPDLKQVIFSILSRFDRLQDIVSVIQALRTYNVKHISVLNRFLEPARLAILSLVVAYEPTITNTQQAVLAKRVDNIFLNDSEWSHTDSTAKYGFYALLRAGLLNPREYPENILFVINSRRLFERLEGIALLAQNKCLNADYCAYVLTSQQPFEKAQCLSWYETVKDSIPKTHKRLFKEIFVIACFRSELFVFCLDLHKNNLLDDEVMILIFNHWLFISNCPSFKDTLSECMSLGDSESLKDSLANSSPTTIGQIWESSVTLLGGANVKHTCSFEVDRGSSIDSGMR